MENLLAKFFSGEATPSEQERVLTWRSASEENAKAFFDYKDVWQKTTTQAEVDENLLAQILGEASDTPDQEIKVVPIWYSKSFQLAASLLIILGIVFSVYQFSGQSADLSNIEYQSLASQTLPDGTEVILYQDAKVEWAFTDSERSIKLKGKAYFDVARDENKPFVIQTERSKVRVLGTSFVVNASETNNTEVLVESGVVAFSDLEGEKSVELVKGEQAALTNEHLAKSSILDENYLAWKTRQLTFKKTSLADVAQVLEGVYEVEIAFENTGLKNCLLTATFDQKDISEVMSILSLTFDIEFVAKGEKVTLSGSGCN